MSEKDKKNIMDDVIDDIASASTEAVEELQEETAVLAEEVAELEAEREEEASPKIMHADAETIIVKFDDELDAARAVRVVNKALRKRHESIYQGAVVSIEKDEEIRVEDLRDMGLADVITGTAGIGLNLGRDGFRLAWTAATTGIALISSGIRLLRRTALNTAGLAGSTWTIPRRKRLEDYDEQELDTSAATLEPGDKAVVIVADHATAAEIATDLVKSGGELV